MRDGDPRWCIETCFSAVSKFSWTDWRHVTLSMWSLALLSAVRAADVEVVEKKRASLSSLLGFSVAGLGVVAASGAGQAVGSVDQVLSVAEIRRLLWRLVVLVRHGADTVGLVQVAAAPSS